jgi:large subunit ribosomal protein L2
MAVKKYKAITPGTRYYSIDDFSSLTNENVEGKKKLISSLIHKTGGRNNTGRITSRHRGGGHKRRYRHIDFVRNVDGVFTVESIDYDPNRSAHIALLKDENGSLSYIIAPNEVNVGDKLEVGNNADIKSGNCLQLNKVPVGTFIYNVEMKPGKGGQIARSAGTFAQLVNKSEKYCQVKLPSGEVRLILSACRCTVGIVGNGSHENVSYGKAGRMTWLGIRPQTRGMAMNPIDHPMGGGEGRSKSGGGRKHPRTPWGKITKGLKTRAK